MSAGDPYAPVRAFLTDAGVRPEFAAAAYTRIEAQHANLGDSFRRASLSMLVGECCEEAVDLAAWAALCSTRLERDGGDPFTGRRARALLTAATQRAAEADLLLCELRRLVERVVV